MSQKKTLADVLFLLCFLSTLGAGALYLGLKFLRRRVACLHWRQVEGKIISTGVDALPPTGLLNKGGTHYMATVRYEYRLDDGKKLQGNNISFRIGEECFNSRARAEAWLEKYQEGVPVTVWYDSRNPSSCVLNPGLGSSYVVWLLLVAFGLLMFYAAAIVLLHELHLISDKQALHLIGLDF
jgi:hypothetical protein